jgi:hypothetical protein
MPFNYVVRKMGLPGSGYTTRPSYGTPISENELLDILVNSSAVSRGDILSIFNNAFGFLVSGAKEGRPSDLLFNYFRVGFSCGGGFDDPNKDLTIDDIKPVLHLYLANEAQNVFRANLALQKIGIDPERQPYIDLVRNELNHNLDSYTPGDAIRVQGHDLKFDPNDNAQGIFLTDSQMTTIRLQRYLTCTTNTVVALIPLNLAGPQTLTIKVKYGQNLRQTVHGHPLI